VPDLTLVRTANRSLKVSMQIQCNLDVIDSTIASFL
jgi:hypothetical protein